MNSHFLYRSTRLTRTSIAVVLFAMIVSGAAGQISDQVPFSDSLVGRYSFAGGVENSICDTSAESVSGDPRLVVDRLGVPESAIYFNGADDSITIRWALDLGAPYTFAIWYSAPITPAVGYTLLGSASGLGGGDWWKLLAGGSGDIGINGNTGYESYYFVGNAQIDEWHFAVVSRASDALSFYLDGILLGTQPFEYSRGEHNSQIFLGKDPNDSFYPAFVGTIDEVLIYDRSLSQAEVRQVELETRGGAVSFDSAEDEIFLREGNRFNGPEVMTLQRVLLSLGYDLGADGADGWFGPATDRAVRNYQTDRGLDVTGRINPASLPALQPWDYRVVDHGNNEPVGINGIPVRWEQPSAGLVAGPYGTVDLDVRADGDPIESVFVSFPESDSMAARATPGLISWSPTGRRFVLLEADFYAGSGTSALVLVDVLLRQVATVDVDALLKDQEVGGRTYANFDEIVWRGDELWMKLSVNFLGGSGHPGIDAQRQEAMGDDFARDDPITVGWFVVETPGDVSRQ